MPDGLSRLSSHRQTMPGSSPAYLFILLVFLVLTACSTGRRASSAKPGKKPTPAVVDQLREQRPAYSSFEGKARLKVDSDELKVGVNATIRMVKDSVIWAVITKFGFEVGRSLIRPDSAFIVNRLNKVYYAESLDEYKKQYAIPFGFEAMQDLLLGIPVVIDGKKHAFTYIAPYWEVTLEDGYGLKGSYLLDNQQNFPRVLESVIFDATERKFSSRYGSFEKCVPCKGDLAYEREHSFTENNELKVLLLSFSEISFDKKLTTPFEIPKHYEREE